LIKAVFPEPIAECGGAMKYKTPGNSASPALSQQLVAGALYAPIHNHLGKYLTAGGPSPLYAENMIAMYKIRNMPSLPSLSYVIIWLDND
jgi:hypothetical protein